MKILPKDSWMPSTRACPTTNERLADLSNRYLVCLELVFYLCGCEIASSLYNDILPCITLVRAR